MIALDRLGDRIDVQGGGNDLLYPHHECSAAHAEVLTGAAPFARHYVHAGMIGLDGEKMSKSKGNLVFVSRLRGDGVDPMAVRLALLAGHYRADRQWTDDVLKAAQQRLARWRAAAAARPARPGPRCWPRCAPRSPTTSTPRAPSRWSTPGPTQALAGVGDDPAPRPWSPPVDALLGIRL